MPASTILAADVGGTKTLLQLVDLYDGQLHTAVEKRYESDLFPTFEGLVRQFLESSPAARISAACFAVAGPVIGRAAKVTNLPWVINADALEHALGIEQVALVNDFYAVAAGVPKLTGDDVLVLQQGKPEPSSPIAVLGAGTGLGEAYVFPLGGEWRIVPSEGGHVSFAPADEMQDELLRHLRRRYGHVSWERVLSGPGLVNIFTFLRDRSPEMAQYDIPVDEDNLPAAISEHAAKDNPLALRTMEMFIDLYGAEAGNVALKALTRGGVFLAGGIAAKNSSRFTDGRFIEAFRNKGRFRRLLSEFPVNLITNARVGVIGAAATAEKMARL